MENLKRLEDEITEALTIDESNLKEELLRQPSLYFYWTVAWSLASKQKRLKKLKVREMEAKLTREFRELMAQTNPSLKLTEKIIYDYLNEHQEYQKICKELIEAEYTEDILSGAKESFRMRGQSLLELVKDEGLVSTNEFEMMKAFREELAQREKKREKKQEKKVKEQKEQLEE